MRASVGRRGAEKVQRGEVGCRLAKSFEDEEPEEKNEEEEDGEDFEDEVPGGNRWKSTWLESTRSPAHTLDPFAVTIRGRRTKMAALKNKTEESRWYEMKSTPRFANPPSVVES